MRLPKVCYVQIWHTHFVNGVFQRTAIFNHRFDSERKTPLPSYGFRTEPWRSACELKFLNLYLNH